MNTALTCLVAALCGANFPNEAPRESFVAPETNSAYVAALEDVSGEGPVPPRLTSRFWIGTPQGDRTAIRAQSATDPAYDMGPQGQTSADAQTVIQGIDPGQPAVTGPAIPQPGMPFDPFNGGGTFDPLATTTVAPGELQRYYDPYSKEFQYGLLGQQPYQLNGIYGPGLTYLDAGYIGRESTHNVPGHLAVTEANAQWRFSSLLPSGAIFSWKPEFNYRGWDGPSGVSLPGHAYRFASDFEIGSQGPGPWGFQLGFTPQLATDFDKQINSKAWMFDFRAMVFYRVDPTLLLVGGASYWDRVRGRVIPDAGIVWTPDDRWEFRLLYPKSRISVLLGDWGNGAVWLYGTTEYNIEAYQVGLAELNRGDMVEIRDYRSMIGLRSESPSGVAAFVEGGWIYNRHVNFAGKTQDFNIGDGWMIRTGVRY